MQLSNRRIYWAPCFVLGALLSTQTMGSMGVMSIPPLVPFLRKDWNLNVMQIGLFTSMLYAGAATMSAVAGQLVDRFGTRNVLTLGLASTGATVIALGMAPNASWGLATIFLAGFGYSMINPAATKAIMCWFDHQVRGSAMSIKQTGVTLGSALAAAILPSLAYFSSWRVSLFITGSLIILLSGVFYAFYRSNDVESRATSAAMGFWKSFRVVLRNRNIVIVSILGLLFSFVQLSLSTFLVIFLMDSFNFSVIAAGGYLAMTQTCGTFGRVSWGVLSDTLFRGKRKPVLYAVGGLSAITCFVLAFVSNDTPTWVISITAAVFGFCAIGYNGVYHVYVAELAGRDLAGVAIGVSLTIVYLGIIVGTPLFGYLVKTTSSYRVAWLAAGIAMLLAISLLMLIKQKLLEE